MRRVTAPLLVCAAIAGLGSSAFADSASARAGIMRSYQKLMSSMEHRDLAGMITVLAPNFKSIRGSQIENRPQFLRDAAAAFARTTKIYSVTGTLGGLKLKSSNAAVTTNTMTLHAAMPGRDGKQHDLRSTGNYQATWQEIGSKWELLQVVVIGRPTRQMDGKSR